MFKSNWGGGCTIGITIGFAITIFSVVWLIGLNYCPESPCNYDYKHTHGPADGPSQHQSLIPRPDLPKFTLQPEPEFREYEPTQYEYADLTAQENMARATNWIAWLSLGAFITASAGVILLVQNLNVTREVGRDQSRAYVHVKSIHAKYRSSDDGEDAFVDCIFAIENSGATPCKRFEIIGGAICGGDDPIFDDLPAPNAKPSGWSALPSGEVFTAPLQYKLVDFENVEKPFILHIGGSVRYWTFFDEEFVTEFSFMLRGDISSGFVGGKRSKMSRSPLKIKTYDKIG